MPPFVRQAIVRVLLWIVLSGCAVASYAFWTRDTTQLTSRLVSDIANIEPDHIWATGDRTFTGYRARFGQITIWNITASEEKVLTALRNVDAADAVPGSVAVARDGSRAIWLANDHLVSYDLDRQSGRSVGIADLEPNSLVQVSESNAVVVVSPSGLIRIFRASSLTPVITGTIPVRNADLTEASGPFIAIAERSTGSVVVVDTRVTSKIGLTESRNLGTRVAAIALTGAGTLAIATESGSILAGEKLGAPGMVRALQHYDDISFLVAGEFRGVHLIPIGAATQEVSTSEPGARAIATTSRFLVLAYPGRLQTLALRYVSTVRPKAMNLLLVWMAASFVLLLFPFFRTFGRTFRLLYKLLFQGSSSQQRSRNKPEKMKHIAEIGQPPTELLECAADRSCVIFAGEELSRTSGMPPWRSFVLGFIDRLYDALLLDPADAESARKAHRAGEFDQVAKRLAPLALENHEILDDFARSMYRKPAALTQVHEALAEVGACAFVTPNLDSLLERCFRIADTEVFVPANSGDALSCLLRRQFVGMKLRGVFEQPETLHVWPSEAHALNARQANLRSFLGAILNNRSTVFVGAGMEEIELWLEPADLPAPPTRRHYALIPKTEAHSEKRAKALSARFNIQFLTYPADDPTTLIEFLSKLTARPGTDAASSVPAATSPSKI